MFYDVFADNDAKNAYVGISNPAWLHLADHLNLDNDLSLNFGADFCIYDSKPLRVILGWIKYTETITKQHTCLPQPK